MKKLIIIVIVTLTALNAKAFSPALPAPINPIQGKICLVSTGYLPPLPPYILVWC